MTPRLRRRCIQRHLLLGIIVLTTLLASHPTFAQIKTGFGYMRLFQEPQNGVSAHLEYPMLTSFLTPDRPGRGGDLNLSIRAEGQYAWGTRILRRNYPEQYPPDIRDHKQIAQLGGAPMLELFLPGVTVYGSAGVGLQYLTWAREKVEGQLGSIGSSDFRADGSSWRAYWQGVAGLRLNVFSQIEPFAEVSQYRMIRNPPREALMTPRRSLSGLRVGLMVPLSDSFLLP